MHLIIRKFSRILSVDDAVQRAQTGVLDRLQRLPGFVAYYIFDAGGGVGGSVSFFADPETAHAANDLVCAWAKLSIADLYDGEPEVTFGHVLFSVNSGSATLPLTVPSGSLDRDPISDPSLDLPDDADRA